MVIVKPGDVVTQHREDVVVYQLKFDDWSAGLDRPDNKNARITQRVVTGEALNLRVLPYENGSQMQQVRLSGGGKKRGEYEIVRLVKSATETRRRSFTVRLDQ